MPFPTEIEINESELNAELCRRSFHYFFVDFWDEINSDRLYDNWHIKVLCDAVQEILDLMIEQSKISKQDDFDFEKTPLFNDDMLANVPPGASKSTIISQMSLAWVWTKMPECVGIFSTISNKNAKDFSQKFKKLIQCEKYREYFPGVEFSKDSGEALFELKNTHGGARFQYTTLSAKTGMHAHYISVDDNMAFEDARSDSRANACNESLKGLFSREKKNAAVPKFFFMQMQSQIDSTQWILKRFPKILRFVFPAWDNGKIFPTKYKEYYKDGYLNPYHMGKEFLEKKKLQYALDEDKFGDLQYLAEYGQDCETSAGYLYSIQKIKKIEERGVCLAVADPADDGECYMAAVYARIYNNRCYIFDIVYTQEDSDITIPLNAEKAKQYKPTTFFVENDGLGAMYFKALRARYGLTLKFNAKGNKVDRIFSKGEIISKFFVFLEQSPSIQYENAVNHITTYKRVGDNKYKDVEDALTSLATIIERNNLINFYA